MGTFLIKNLKGPHFVLIAIIVLLPQVASAASIVRAPNSLGLIGYWSFDEGHGTQVNDLSGNQNNGTLINGPSWTNGKVNGALELDGVNDYVTVPNSSILNVTSSLTISLWFRLNTSSGYVDLLNKTGGSQYFLGLDSGLGNNPYFKAGDTVTEAVITIENGKWYHLVGVFDDTGNTNKIYVNGDLIVTEANTGTTPTNSGPITIGAWDSGLESFLDGKIDEVRLYSRALSDSEVQNLYNNSKSVILGNTSASHTDGLVAHYTFDGSTIIGTTLRDVRGSSDGTIAAGPSPTIGKIGQAMQFNGSSNGVNLGNPNALRITGDQTIAMWLFPDNFSARRNPYAKAYGGEGTITQEIGGALNYYYGTSGTNGGTYQGFSSGSAVQVGRWNHVAIVRDLSSTPRRLRWYINGVETSATNASYAAATAGTQNALIGYGYTSPYAGKIDDVRIYDRALSAEEVRGLAGGGLGTVESKAPFQKGNILMERWESIGSSGSVSAIPLNTSPNHTELRSSFEAPTNWGDQYGLRMRGYIYPETTGNYTFWIASDDNGQLWLSSDSTSANKSLIASVSSYTSSRQWNKESNQKSAEIYLVAGQRYYIEALMKEGGGGDNLSVSWKLNDTTDPTNGSAVDIIPGSALSPWVE